MRPLMPGVLGVTAAALALWPASASAAPDPRYSGPRLDRVAAALAKDPLYVDPDVEAALGAADRARVDAAIRAAAQRVAVPILVVAAPNPTASESQGKDDAFLSALHGVTRRDGLYLMVDDGGYMLGQGWNVPREIDLDVVAQDDAPDYEPPDIHHPFGGLADRLINRVNAWAAAPAAPPTSSPALLSPPAPFGQEDDRSPLVPDEPSVKSHFLRGFLLVGPASAVALYWAGIGTAAAGRRWFRRGGTRGALAGLPAHVEEHPRAPAKPSDRWLRRTASAELDRLRDRLPDASVNNGRAFALAAYDAAQILYDDVQGQPGHPLDLAGVIVLARQGRHALAGLTTAPPPPCFVNPLHGDATRRKTVALPDGGKPRRRPLCTACERASAADLAERVLRVQGPDGLAPHYAVPGVWRDAAWGSRGNDLVKRVMEYLGVE
ncbi:hypothetical protein F8568_007920 [Actinomadura sp. LD22]|uniref:TPM domain-containing protein n=1 Tax=Actinomadura physcomitrii TaxID=2650748 RepID=A0A6I4MCC5_9ACTN|nr:hypothetical protein [Actinomadura physcomitrii]MWA00299.1 hypothetical protein [Actinomadura physcomitrii]